MKDLIARMIEELWGDTSRPIQDSADDLLELRELIDGKLEAAREMGKIE